MLEGIAYVPILRTRVAEIQAYRELDGITKARIFPIFALRPWPNANKLQKVFEKLGQAAGGNRFALDLDETRRDHGSEKGAQADFDSLFDEADGFASYYQLVESLPTAVPVLRDSDGSFAAVDRQKEHIARIGRGVVIRIRWQKTLAWAAHVQSLMDLPDLVFVVDAGWVPDVTLSAAWASSTVSQIMELRPEAEIVLSASTFPSEFSKMGSKKAFPINERAWFDKIRRERNINNAYYGDWGSTRADGPTVPMKPVARIDLPLGQEWVSFRLDDDEDDYQDLSNRVVSDNSWQSEMAIWGTNLIQGTADGLGLIKNPAKAAAARINIHLFMQTIFNDGAYSLNTDEPYTDDM